MVLSEFIYGGMDGIITTVAIIGASIGAQLENRYIAILGGSNLLADGFSMGISRYNSLIEDGKQMSNSVFLNRPFYSGIYTFVSFVIMGMLPLIPFIFYSKSQYLFQYFILASLISFILVGHVKSINTKKQSYFKTLIITIVTGSMGALISYYVASKLKSMIM